MVVYLTKVRHLQPNLQLLKQHINRLQLQPNLLQNDRQLPGLQQESQLPNNQRLQLQRQSLNQRQHKYPTLNHHLHPHRQLP